MIQDNLADITKETLMVSLKKFIGTEGCTVLIVYISRQTCIIILFEFITGLVENIVMIFERFMQ